MFELSQRLIDSALRWNIDDYSAVFDQVVKARRYAQKAMYRVGFWPIVSDSEPETAIGVGLVLAALLEQWQSVCVYRLMAEVPAYLSEYSWSIDKSQFGVDDWEVEGLDENVAIWGTLEVENGHVRFLVETENDARDDDEVLKLEVSQDSVAELLNTLPSVAEKIIMWIDSSAERVGSQYSLTDSTDRDMLDELLNKMVHWELQYYFALWGNELDAPIDDLQLLVKLSQQMNTDFGAWMLAQSISRILKFDQINWSQTLVSQIRDILEKLGDQPIFVAMTCITLFRLDYGAGVFDLLENNLLMHPENSLVWNTLAIIYNSLREDLATIDVYQRAIENNSANASTYRRYAELMILLNNQQIHLKSGNQHISPAGRPFMERYIYADSEEESLNLYEAAKAYQNAVEQNSEDLESLMQLVKCLTILEDKQIWDYCRKLVGIDTEGGVTATIIDQLPDDDIPFMIEILQKLQLNTSFPTSIRINLARSYLAVGEYDKASHELAQLPKDDLSPQNRILVSRLSLAAQILDFDTKIAEIGDILGSNGEISEDDIEFLEGLIEKEPAFTEGYGLLARSYLSRNEQDAALEVLLDCQNDAPFDAEVTALLAKILWDEGQSDLAFAYLEKGLNQDKRNATLLSLNGRFLFENGQDEEAKEMLLSAEGSDPLNAELAATRRYIANALVAAKKN
jgi:Tfp pilus assembly protein PilF